MTHDLTQAKAHLVELSQRQGVLRALITDAHAELRALEPRISHARDDVARIAAEDVARQGGSVIEALLRHAESALARRMLDERLSGLGLCPGTLAVSDGGQLLMALRPALRAADIDRAVLAVQEALQHASPYKGLQLVRLADDEDAETVVCVAVGLEWVHLVRIGDGVVDVFESHANLVDALASWRRRALTGA